MKKKNEQKMAPKSMCGGRFSFICCFPIFAPVCFGVGWPQGMAALLHQSESLKFPISFKESSRTRL